MMWKSIHLFIEGFTPDYPHQSKIKAIKSKELSAEVRDEVLQCKALCKAAENVLLY